MTYRHDSDCEPACANAGSFDSTDVSQPPKFDADDYLRDLDDLDLNTDQKREVLTALWHLLERIVDIGFGMDTIHTVLPEMFEKVSRESAKLLSRESVNTPLDDETFQEKGSGHD